LYIRKEVKSVVEKMGNAGRSRLINEVVPAVALAERF
jgi:hypothetical protein